MEETTKPWCEFCDSKGGLHKVGCPTLDKKDDLLGVDLGLQEEKEMTEEEMPQELIDQEEAEKAEQATEPEEVTEEKPQEEEIETIEIENFPEVLAKVREEDAERKLNPSSMMEGDAGVNFLDGEPHIVIDNEYVPHAEAMIVLQTRKVVREYLKLQRLIKGIIE